MLKSSRIEDNVITKFTGQKKDGHKSWKEHTTPKTSNNHMSNLSAITSDTDCLQKMVDGCVRKSKYRQRNDTRNYSATTKILVCYHIQTTTHLNQNAIHCHIL